MWKSRSTILSPERASFLGQGAVLASLLAVVTCAGAARGPVEPRRTPTASEKAAASGSVAPGTAAPVRASGAPVDSAAPPATGAPLARFRAALDALASGTRNESVRVLWLGDSHTAADFWPDAVRRSLSAKYGSGGPGFLYVGLAVYRHAGVKVGREGRFRVEPKRPSLWMRQNDGVFGLGGMRTVPDTDSCRVTLELGKDAVTGEANWDLSFRLPTPRSRFRVSIDGGKSFDVDATTRTVGSIEHLSWTTPKAATVNIERSSGEPEFFGVTVDGAKPGVVVDTLGINGARIGTPLAWEEGPWLAEAARRSADLFVLAYGTNEIGDQVAPSRYAPEVEGLVQRARKAAPAADCLVVGPTDRAGPKWEPLPRTAEIDGMLRTTATRLGCAYFSAQAAMGGAGSLKDWAMREPPLAAPDKVHLTPRGYAELGAKMATELFGLPPPSESP